MDYHQLSQEFKRLRRESGYSQQRMAEHLCISRATINAFENGRASDIGLKKFLLLIDYLDKRLVIKDRSPFPTLDDLRNE